jgi:L-fuconolactonase
MEPWASQLRDLARHDNVMCKLSGLTTEADPAAWTVADLRPFVDVALDCFGPARLMFGSDWPVATLGASYAGWVDAVDELIGALSEDEQEAIRAGTARRFYRL